ncbi:MAG: putative Ig domain-containing protein [Myxococcota bacterium]
MVLKRLAVLVMVLLGTSCGVEVRDGADGKDLRRAGWGLGGHAVIQAGDPNLVLGVVTRTPISGDGDVNADPGEAVELQIQLTNPGGAGDALEVAGLLTTNDPNVTLVQPSSAYPDVPVDGSAVNTTPFIIRTATSAACGSTVSLALVVTSQDTGSPRTFPVTVTLDVGGIQTTTFTSTTVLAVPDGVGAESPGPVVSSTLAVSGVSGPLQDLDFRFNGGSCNTTTGSTTVGLDHTFVGDLVIRLQSPSGTTVTLVNRLSNGGGGNSGNNFCTTALDDAASPLIQAQLAAAAPFVGTFKPANPLSAFNGENPNGNWTLSVQDYFVGDTGNVRSWSLVVGVSNGACTTCAPFDVAPDTLPDGQADTPYSQTLTATGGTGPYTFTTTAGALPAGLTLATNGTLSGTTTTASDSTFRVQAQGADACRDYQDYTLHMAAHIQLTTSTLPDGTGSNPYQQQLTATGGTEPYTYALTSGALPAGLTLDASGLLSGTSTVAGDFTFEVTATDANAESGVTPLTLRMVAPLLALQPSTLPDYVASTPYSVTLGATGGADPYTLELTQGVLPSGLSFASSGISGVATVAGSFPLEVKITDANGFTAFQQVTLVGQPPVILVDPTALADVVALEPMTVSFTAQGAQAPYTFAVGAGSLPAGLELSSDGVLSGSATQAGDFSFTVTATDANGFTGSVSLALHVTPPVVTVLPDALADFVASNTYQVAFSAQGGAAPYSFTVVDGALPPGLALSSDGILAGAATQAGDFTFTVQAQDQYGFVGMRGLALHGATPTIVIDVTDVTLVGGETVQQDFVATGGAAPYTFSVDGTLPPGLSLSPSGALSGRATAAGDFSFTLNITDANGLPGSTVVTIHVSAPTLTLQPDALPDFVASRAYSVPLTVQGGTAPFTFAVVDGALPPGLTLAGDGVLSGVATQVGDSAFTVRAQDADGFSVSGLRTLHGTPPTLTVSPATLPDGREGRAYSQTLVADGGAEPYTFQVSAGSLPPGLTLGGDGALTGTPTQPGGFSFTVQATDVNNFTGQGEVTVSIVARTVLEIAPDTLDDAIRGQLYEVVLSATGGSGSYTFTVAPGVLPDGLVLAQDGTLDGTPTQAGQSTFTVMVRDVEENFGTRDYTLNVVEPDGGVATDGGNSDGGGTGADGGSVDGGAEADAAVVADAGSSTDDAGTESDAGAQPSDDAGTPDAAQRSDDAGTNQADAGGNPVTPDAGGTGGAGAGPGVEPGNGCACDASSTANVEVPLALMLVVAWRARRRR